jgi:hypothetical protein
VSLHLVPVVFGAGTPMFTRLEGGQGRLEPVDVLATPSAIHLRYRVLR